MENLQILMWYWGTSFVLAFLLYFPLNKLVFTIQIRKIQRQLGRFTTDEENEKQKRRAKLVAGIIAITFSFMFNRTLLPISV
ncbi:MAG: hypothetical protein HQM14_05540 [SAR324 cluster bacterium]|nr:hypothetical protein [SAR324 cluster bacterium]